MFFWAAISIGLLGSAHCAGMCGPLLVTVNSGAKWTYSVLHHLGRIFTYMCFGAVAGAIGKSFNILGFQQQFSLVIGILMVISVIAIPLSGGLRKAETWISRWSIRFSSWTHRQGFSPHAVRFLGGIGNGLLPCGLVYLAVAGAANTFTPWDGALFMLLFGLGTLPVLLIVSLAGARLGSRLRSQLRKVIPLTVFIMGCLLIIRGMNLGIPMLSPERPVAEEQITECH